MTYPLPAPALELRADRSSDARLEAQPPALRHVVPNAVDQRSQLTLLTVVPDPPRAVTAAGVSPERLTDEMEKEAERHLRQVAATLPHDLSVTFVAATRPRRSSRSFASSRRT